MIYWLLYFYIYCFIGWCWETIFVSLKQKHFVNRGFLKGCMLPIYGFGAIFVILMVYPFRNNLLLTYLIGVIAPTLLELVVGQLMEQAFKVRYWDYTKKPFNYHGYICLTSSLFWGLLTVLVVNFVQDPLVIYLNQINYIYLTIVTILISIIFLTDVYLSTKDALDLRKVIIELEKINEKLELKTKNITKELSQDFTTLKRDVVEQAKEQELKANELKALIELNNEKKKQVISKLKKQHASILKRNPTFTIPGSTIILDELKSFLNKYKKEL